MIAPVAHAAARSEKIAKTVPVLQTGGDFSRVIKFIGPRHSTLETLPLPNNPQVRPVAVPPARMAVVECRGLARQDDVDAKTAALLRFVKPLHLESTGAPSIAQFDAPWTLWFFAPERSDDPRFALKGLHRQSWYRSPPIRGAISTG